MSDLVIEPSRPAPGVAVLNLEGEFDLAWVEPVRAALRLLESDRPERLVIDLRGVTFIESVALGVLVGAERRAREAGHRLEIVAQPRGAIARLLEITLLTSYFNVDTEVRAGAAAPAG